MFFASSNKHSLLFQNLIAGFPMSHRSLHHALFFIAIALTSQTAYSEDWVRFRGVNGAGVSSDTKVPINWSDTKNLVWKTAMPGAGSSSPIVAGDHVFVTCYSGYGVPTENAGSIEYLERHLVCLNRNDGTIEWKKTNPGGSPEDRYQGYISEHGYVSNTPTVDNERVYCFLGKSGVIAFDFNGEQLWQTNVGKESGNRQWGSGASLVLYKDLVIVNASEENQAIIALDKSTGKERWKAQAATLELAYGTPSLVKINEDRVDLVVGVPGEVWGLNPDTGKLTWFAEHDLTGNICPSIISKDDLVFVFGGFRSAGSFAVRAGGDGDVTDSKILWTSRNSSYVATPILYEGHLYWISDNGQAFCVVAETGELVYRERVAEIKAGGRPVYASPVIANGNIYVPSRKDGVLVLPAKPTYSIIAQNQFTGDESDFNATPAISDNQMFIRSNSFLYCLANGN